jgi:iron complex transport system substrate-binding protein
MTDYFPKRIVCLTEETTETLYLLGEQDRIIGISGFTVRPPQARKEKTKVSAFTSAKIEKIVSLQPDLVLGFSDLQADIANDLIRHGLNVHIFNQRSVHDIFCMITSLGAMVGCQQKALSWIEEIEENISSIKKLAQEQSNKPKVYFEEWYNPIISGIQWVSEIIEIAGGKDCFPEHSKESLAKNRIVSDPFEVVRRQPDIIIGSWCGRRFRPEIVLKREGWQNVPAIQNEQIFEIKSADILQPGPAVLTDGLAQVRKIIENWYDTVHKKQ